MGQSEFVDFKSKGFTGQIRKDYAAEDFVAFLKDLDDNIGEVEDRHYEGFDKRTDRLVTTIEVPVGGEKRTLILKQDDFTRAFNISKSTKYTFKQSRGMRGWQEANRMLDAGISVPVPVAYFEKRSVGVFKKGYFLMEYVEGSKSLRDSLGRGKEADALLLKKAGETIRRLHEMGATHGDLKSTNFLVKEGEIFLIDSEDVKSGIEVKTQMRLKNLGRLLKSLKGDMEENIRVVFDGYEGGGGKGGEGTVSPLSIKELREYMGL